MSIYINVLVSNKRKSSFLLPGNFEEVSQSSDFQRLDIKHMKKLLEDYRQLATNVLRTERYVSEINRKTMKRNQTGRNETKRKEHVIDNEFQVDEVSGVMATIPQARASGYFVHSTRTITCALK